MNFKRFETQVPSEYQELTFISNNGTQYIDTGLKGSDLADCELEIVMRNNTTNLSAYNFNGTYLSGSTAQFGLVATSNSECRSSMNFGFADAISTTGLNISEFHTIYATNGLQKVDNTVVGTLNFGILNGGNFLLFARTDPNQTSGINICVAMSLKSFTVKRNNQYIRNMIPAKRKSDNTFGLYDTVNGVFYTNQGTGDFTGGTVVEPTWHDIPYYIHTTSTDTLATLPADIYANDTTATVGLKGDMEQSSTPTPQTPIQPQECGERTVNLVENRITTSYGGSIIGSDGVISPSGAYDTWYAKVTAGETYTMSRVNGVYAFYSAEPQNGSASIDDQRYYTDSDGTKTVTIPTGVTYVAMRTLYNGDTPMLNAGSTALPYEPYGQYKIPILSNSTTTPVYLGEVQSTRIIKKYEFTGDEAWGRNSGNSVLYLAISDGAGGNAITSMCTEYPAIVNVSAYANMADKSICIKADGSAIWIRDTDISSATDFKTHLSQQYANGTPVCVWCVLATPTTGIVNEPIRKIGTYADEVSNITIPTIAGANTISVDTTLQPSEVTVNYKGWHPVTDVHERENGQWD